MKRIIVWFRGDLRVHDHPALAAACQDADEIIPLFILDPNFLQQKVASNRNRFLLEGLKDLDRSLKARGGRLVLKKGNPTAVLATLAKEMSAEAVYYIADYTLYSVQRDKSVAAELAKNKIAFKAFSGQLIVSSSLKLRTKTERIYTVFTPFWKAWLALPRRELADVPKHVNCPQSINSDPLPALKDITHSEDLSPQAIAGGETAARALFEDFLANKLEHYHQGPTDMAADNTSHLSAALHFGCLSPLELESRLPDSRGARAWNRQLAWREFYNYVLLHFPTTPDLEFQERARSLKWDNKPAHIKAWQLGQTGYPIVDAGMRELIKTGFMHNRARMIVGSFLTKHLWSDWRIGEAYFRRMLLDGDVANNVGNWQWIAGVGVDPAPFYRRLYNPTLQAQRLDPSGNYIRCHVPELAHVPDEYIFEPWTMPEEVQQKSGCLIGRDYPAPIVDHRQARVYALERYRQAVQAK